MKFKWRKWNRAIHRDFGYIFFAVTIIYAVSGIAINHLNDWNPNYKITITEVVFEGPNTSKQVTKENVMTFLKSINEIKNYKKHYFPQSNEMKIFLDGGNITVFLENGYGIMEKIKRRPVLHVMNFLHYNPGKWWTMFSDIYCVALVILAISGLFIVRGKNGITRRGAILTSVGIIVPVIYILIFY
ncbi:MAG: PepSY-associated TM helix domain-containing protein [Bacteroidales bacterium]